MQKKSFRAEARDLLYQDPPTRLPANLFSYIHPKPKICMVNSGTVGHEDPFRHNPICPHLTPPTPANPPCFMWQPRLLHLNAPAPLEDSHLETSKALVRPENTIVIFVAGTSWRGWDGSGCKARQSDVLG